MPVLANQAEPPSPTIPVDQQGRGKRRSASLAELAEEGALRAFDLPKIEEGKVAAAGIRKLAGKHLILYTDLPSEPEIDELPHVFDAAVPLLADYFGIAREKVADWKVVGCLIGQRERFQGAGLYPEGLPEFGNGYSRGSQFWLYDQPSGYYRRHLMLHEGVHGFMHRWLGGAGPPWYMEGMAELLATHRWADGQLELAYMPRSNEEVPYWGRVKIIRDEFANQRGMPLDDILKYDHRAHLRQEPYGWCWGAAYFFDQHPLTQSAFRALKTKTGDRSEEFSNQFKEMLAGHGRQIAEDWQLFIIECDYGYDVPRAAIAHTSAAELPTRGASATIAADRGWQSTGFRVEEDKTYRITAEGQYTIAGEPRPWPCEPDGVTIRYAKGHPLGMLLAGVTQLEENVVVPYTPLAEPTAIGRSGLYTPKHSGTLYLKINEPSAGLADNAGELSVMVTPET